MAFHNDSEIPYRYDLSVPIDTPSPAPSSPPRQTVSPSRLQIRVPCLVLVAVLVNEIPSRSMSIKSSPSIRPFSNHQHGWHRRLRPIPIGISTVVPCQVTRPPARRRVFSTGAGPCIGLGTGNMSGPASALAIRASLTPRLGQLGLLNFGALQSGLANLGNTISGVYNTSTLTFATPASARASQTSALTWPACSSTTPAT